MIIILESADGGCWMDWGLAFPQIASKPHLSRYGAFPEDLVAQRVSRLWQAMKERDDIYIYIERERERERDVYIYIYIHIHTYTYTYAYVDTYIYIYTIIMISFIITNIYIYMLFIYGGRTWLPALPGLPVCLAAPSADRSEDLKLFLMNSRL